MTLPYGEEYLRHSGEENESKIVQTPKQRGRGGGSHNHTQLSHPAAAC